MPEPMTDFNHNTPIYSVSEISGAIKRTVEDHFGVIRLRGEISGFKLASSGHAYYKLKDADAVIDAISWKGLMSKLSFKPEDGLEVIVTGKITTYPGRSSYQIIVDRIEPAGAGALMAVLEKRKAMLAAEGLFDAARKKPLPFLPRVIGVITSPSGAVIRDILHRIEDRFPVHVIVWPVMVQGEGAAEQIATAIAGFNDLTSATYNLLPDLLIVARGGGSIEDLWAFNEEVVVRAAANSRIPLISAVGHETDTTLIDYASDKRAPTPTAAAEMAVPVRSELLLTLKQLDLRQSSAMQNNVQRYNEKLAGLARGLPKPERLLELAVQKLDDWSERLQAAPHTMIERATQKIAVLSAQLKPQLLLKDMYSQQVNLAAMQERLHTTLVRQIQQKSERLSHLAQLLENMSVQRVLERGFALVRGENETLITTATNAQKEKKLSIQFADGTISLNPKP